MLVTSSGQHGTLIVVLCFSWLHLRRVVFALMFWSVKGKSRVYLEAPFALHSTQSDVSLASQSASLTSIPVLHIH